GLSKPWAGKLWLNPPYGKGAIEPFTAKLARHYAAGEVTEALALVNNATETQWFNELTDVASAVCFPAGRGDFLDKAGKPGGHHLQGQAVVYLGDDVAAFREAFAPLGKVFEPTKADSPAGRTASPRDFDLVEEGEAILAWLEKRRQRWPEHLRAEFI